MYATQSNPYQQQAVTTATPAQLLIMLFDRALVAIGRVQTVEDPRAPAGIAVLNDELQLAQDILTELQLTLDHEVGGEIAANLDALYAFCVGQLVQANITKDLDGLSSVASILTELRNTFEEASRLQLAASAASA